MRLTLRGWAVLAAAAFTFGIATGNWTYYDYSPTSAPYPVIEENLP